MTSFYEEEMPSFNYKLEGKQKSNRLPRAEILAASTEAHCQIRATFHAKQVSMPPMASATSIDRVISEHSYL